MSLFWQVSQVWQQGPLVENPGACSHTECVHRCPEGLGSFSFATSAEVSSNCLVTFIGVRVCLLPLKNISPTSESEKPAIWFSICAVFSLVYFDAFSEGLLFLSFNLSIIFYIQICILDACTVWKMAEKEVLLQLLLNFEWFSASRFKQETRARTLLKQETRANLAMGWALANRIPTLWASKASAMDLLQGSLVKESLQLNMHPISLPAQRLCWVSGSPWKSVQASVEDLHIEGKVSELGTD